MILVGERNLWPQKLQGWKHTWEMAKPYIRANGNGIDVGAREGGFSMQMEDHFDHIYCYDFRPEHIKSKVFFENIKNRNKFTYTVAGIGDKNETRYTTKANVGRIKDRGGVPVKVRTLDSFDLPNVTFIKYDIEGYELKAVRGSEKTIKKYNPVIVVEQNKGDTDAKDLLESWGYVCKGIDAIFNQDYLMVKE